MLLLFKGGRVVDPSQGLDGVCDLLVAEGKIKAIGENLSLGTGEGKVFPAQGLIITPGLIDLHVHLREPGEEEKETIATGTRAAAWGGFTAVVAMPNTKPPADNVAVINFVREKAEKEGIVRVYPVGCITKERRGKELAEMGSLAAAGAVAFSDDGRPVMDARLMRNAFLYARQFRRPLISHCEDLNLADRGVMHEGYWSTLLGLKGIPAAAEEVMVAREIILAQSLGAPVHLAHVSTAGAVALICAAKEKGIPVTAEVTPHHLFLTDEAVKTYSSNTKVNPPLRTAADVVVLQAALKDGTIDVIATDHAPHTPAEKDQEFDAAPFGIVGLETAVPLVVTKLIQTGTLTWSQAVERLSLKPAGILGLPGGTLKVGAAADITVIDPELELSVDPATFQSRGRNSPFQGWRLKGWPVAVFVDGKCVMKRKL